MSRFITRLRFVNFLVYSLWLIAGLGASSGPQCTHVTPKPGDKFECGVVGEMRYPTDPSYPMADIQIVATVEECARLCSRRVINKDQFQENYSGYSPGTLVTWCQSFYYDTKRQVCQLGLQPVKFAAKPTKKGDLTFYDYQCWDCGAFCSRNGTQLLDNGDFEGELFGPWYTVGTEPAKGYKSSRACRCGTQCLLSQSANMCEGQLYSLDFEYMFAGPTIPVTQHSMSVQLGNMYGTFATFQSDIFGPQDPTWVHGRIYYRANFVHNGPLFKFTASGNSTTAENRNNSVLVDNVVLSPVPEPSVKPGAKSRFVNGDFETGSLSPWQVVRPTGSTTNPTLKVIKPGLSGSDYALSWAYKSAANSYTALTQTATTIPNRVYLFSIDINLPSTKAKSWSFKFEFGPASDLRTLSGSGKKGNQTFSIPVLATTKSTQFGFYASTYRHSTVMLVDNIRLLEIESDKFY